MNKCFVYRNNSPNALELKCIEVWLISCTLFVFFALLEYFVVLFGIRYDKHWRHKKQDLERINATTWERPSENTQPTLAAVAAAAAAAAASNNTNSTNHHRPTHLPPLVHHRVTNNRVDNLRLFGGSSKIVPQEEIQDHHTKEMTSLQSTIIRVSFNNNVIIICLIYMKPKLNLSRTLPTISIEMSVHSYGDPHHSILYTLTMQLTRY